MLSVERVEADLGLNDWIGVKEGCNAKSLELRDAKLDNRGTLQLVLTTP